MRNPTWGGYRTINAFVTDKLSRLDEAEKSFAGLFELMFSERDNILYERSSGYRVTETTYGEAYDHILHRTEVLRGLLPQAEPNAVVGLYMENSLEWIEMLWTILRAGFCPLLMNMRLDDETLESALRDSGAVAVVSERHEFSVPTVDAAAVTPTGSPTSDTPFGQDILVMSSGTSRHVKICAYSAAEFACQIRDSYQIICRCTQMKKHYHGRLKLLTFLPFYHIFGLTAVYIWFAFFSRTFVHLQDMAPQTILNTIRRHEVTHIFAVPLFWETVYDQALKTIRSRGEKTWKKFQKGLRIAEAIGDVPLLGKLFSRIAFREVREGMFGDSIRFLITGGSRIGQNIVSFFNAIGYHLADGYGMSEIGITSVELSTRRKIRNACYVGRPLSSVEYKINAEGELLVRGQSTARYIIEDGVRRPRGDWFETKDLASCVNGHYLIAGRRDDLVIGVSGENLNPNLIEPKFDLPHVRGVCLLGIPQDGNIVPVLLVSIQRHLPEELIDSIHRSVTGRIAELKLSGQIAKVGLIDDELMTAEEFKLNRVRLAEDYAAGRLHTPERNEDETAGDTPADALYDHIRELFAAALDKESAEISPQTDFFTDGGGSSLDYLALVTQLQTEYGIAFPAASDGSLNTAGELYQFTKAALENADMAD